MVDRLKFSAIAHRDHLFHSPLSETKAEQLLELLALPPGARVLDAGCGPAELLIRVIERYDARGVGVDLSPYAIAEARSRATQRVPSADLVLHEAPIETLPAAAEGWDLVICIGSTHLYGNYRGALRALHRQVRPGGLLLVGELFWQQPPAPVLLETLGMTTDSLLSHAENVAAGGAAGWIPLYAITSNTDDWDHYEGLYARAVERYALANPTDPDCPALLERSRSWRELYLRHGRGTLGFGFYLFQQTTPGAGAA